MEGGGQQGISDQIDGGKNNSNSNSSSFVCRQSSSRWTPTTEQIRILKDLYYNNGVRSPSAEEIQRISAKLRQYGKIEGKNVFYWFQNHKARERQKKRFTADHHHHHHHLPTNKPLWKTSNNDHLLLHHLSPIFPAPNTAAFPSSSASNSSGLLTVGAYGYGSVAMEKSFRECSINPNANGGAQNFAWIGVDPYSSPYPNFLEKRKYSTNHGCGGGDQTLEMVEEEEEEEVEEEVEEEAAAPEIETLPLFPMHGDIKQESDYFSGWHRRGDDGISAGSRASLELTLNSYAARFPTS